MGLRQRNGLVVLGLIYLTTVYSQEVRVKPIAYNVIRDAKAFPKYLAKNNAEQYVSIIEKATEDIVIFPEYGLITMEVVEKPTDHLEDYSFVIPNKTDTNLCDIDEKGISNQKALKEIGCAAKQYKRHVIFHVLEAQSYYSTIIHVDKDGVMKNVYRKDAIVTEKSVQAFKGQQERNFKIDGTEYWISMGYDPFTKWEPHWKNIIHFSPLQLVLPLFIDLSPALFHSKQYNSMVYSPTLVGCAAEFEKFCPRQNAIVINKGKMNDPSITKNLDLFIVESKYSVTQLTDNKAENGDCKVEIKSKDAAMVQQNYKLATYSGAVNYINKNVTICALVKNDLSFSVAALDFESIVIKNKKYDHSVPVTLNKDLSPIDNFKWDKDKAEFSGEDLNGVVSFGMISGTTSGALLTTIFNIVILFSALLTVLFVK